MRSYKILELRRHDYARTATDRALKNMSNAHESKPTDEKPRVTDEIVARATAELAGRLEATEYDYQDIEKWGTLTAGKCPTGEAPAASVAANTVTEHSYTDLRPADLDERAKAEVAYWQEGPALELIGEGDTNEIGALVHFDPDDARELAYALLQAAAEYERRPVEESEE